MFLIKVVVFSYLTILVCIKIYKNVNNQRFLDKIILAYSRILRLRGNFARFKSSISTEGLLVCIRDCSKNPFCGVVTEQKDCNEKPDPVRLGGGMPKKNYLKTISVIISFPKASLSFLIINCLP